MTTDSNLDKELAEQEGQNARITYNVADETKEYIEEKRNEWYPNSTYKQGKTLDRIVQEHKTRDAIMAELNEMKEMLSELTATSSQASFSVQGVGSADDANTPQDSVGMLVELAEEGQPIDAEEHDLSVVKGVQGIDRAKIVYHALPDDTTGWTKKEVRNFIQDEMQYSRGKANEIADDVLRRHMHQSPLADLPDWLDDQLEAEIADDYARHDPTIPSDKAYKREYGKLADYAGLSKSVPVDTYYATEGEAARAVYNTVLNVGKTVRNGSKWGRKRAINLTAEMLRTVPAELYKVEFYNGGDNTLAGHLTTWIDANEDVPSGLADKIVTLD